MNRLDLSDEISLRILEYIKEKPSITQRDISSRLGIALGLTNSYIKRLCKKGFIKIKNIDGRRISYILTPKGFKEKARLTINYMTRSLNYLKEIKQKIDITYNLMILSGVKNIVIWGSDELAEVCFIVSIGLPINIVGFVSMSRGKKFHNIPVYSKEELREIQFDAILVATFDQKELNDIKKMDAKLYYIWQS